MLGWKEEPDIGKLCSRKQTLGNSCEWEGWRYEIMRLLDRSKQTSPLTWFESWLVWLWASWTSVCWLNGSVAANLKWDANLHSFLEQWITGCRTRTPFREEEPSQWLPSLREYLLLVPLPESPRGPPEWSSPSWTEADKNRTGTEGETRQTRTELERSSRASQLRYASGRKKLKCVLAGDRCALEHCTWQG